MSTLGRSRLAYTIGFALTATACGGSAFSGSDLFAGAVDSSLSDGAGQSAGRPSEAGTDGASTTDGSTFVEAGTIDGSTLACGNDACTLPSQTCCVSSNGGSTYDFACGPSGHCPLSLSSSTTELACSGASSCGSGSVCCIGSAPGGGFSASCKPACVGQEAQLCDPNAAVSGCGARSAGPCSSSNITDWKLPRSYATCGGQGT